MFRALLGLLILFTITACSRGSGFRAENLDYEIAVYEKPPLEEPAKEPYKPGTVVRGSEKIQFKPSKSNWSSNNTLLNLKANVIVNGKDLGEVEFEGKKQDSKIILVPKDEKLKDVVKAQVRCLSEDDSCNEHYIEIGYKEKDVIYIEQIRQTEVEIIPAPVQPVLPAPSTPKPDPAKPAKPEDDDQFETFDDIVDVEATAKSARQGDSDENWRLIFNVPAPSKNSQPSPEKPDQPPAQPAPPSPTPPPGKPPGTPAPTPTPKPPTPAPAPVPPTNAGNSVFQELEKYRAAEQSINYPMTVVDKKTGRKIIGRVNHATDFRALSKIPGIGFLFPSDKTSVYGAFNLATLLAKMGEFMKEILPNKPLQINSIGLFNGGIRPPGASHQNGTDADIRYIRVKDDFDNYDISRDIVDGDRVSNNFMIKEQWQLIKKTFMTGEVDLIAVDAVVKKALCEHAITISDYKKGDTTSPVARMMKRIVPTAGHKDHFHVRVRCGENNSACINVSYKDYPVGCD